MSIEWKNNISVWNQMAAEYLNLSLSIIWNVCLKIIVKNWFTERIFGSFHCAFFFLLLLLFINSYWLSNILPLALSHSSFSFFFVFFLHLCCHKTLQILQAAFIFTASLVLRMVDPSPFLFSKCSFNLHLRNIGKYSFYQRSWKWHWNTI